MAFWFVCRSVLLFLGLQNCVHFSYADITNGSGLGVFSDGNSQACIQVKCPDLPPRTCKDVETSDPRPVVTLLDGYEVLCDTKTDGGGWIIIQRRMDKEVDFYRNWVDYKYGFGNLTGNFWFGNENIHLLTISRRYELRIEFTFNDTDYYTRYSRFRLFGESEMYQLDLDLSDISGNAGDSLSYHDKLAFSTFDRDNDLNIDDNCASVHHGAWWYKSCLKSNLNGLWGSDVFGNGLNWETVTGFYNFATSSEMKIRPIG